MNHTQHDVKFDHEMASSGWTFLFKHRFKGSS